jgi:imidazolonepropionase-like amidohydrolase
MTRRINLHYSDRVPAAGNTYPLQSQNDRLHDSLSSQSLETTMRPESNDGCPDIDTDSSPRETVCRNIITSHLLIPGDGEPVPRGSLVTENDIIIWIGKDHDIPKHYFDEPHKLYAVPFLMPGLWDCHAHFAGHNATTDEANVAAVFGLHPATAGARLARQCWEALQRGYTSLRDLGGYGCEIAVAIDEGTIVGPNIYSAGAYLSQTAGHGDIFELPAGDVLLNYGISQVKAGHHGATVGCICDGADECRRAVRLQIRRGAKCIKVLASGGVLSRDDNPLHAQFCEEELNAIVDEASRMERSVAAHVHGKKGIMAAVKAGVTSVEHVSFADDECISLIKQRGTIFVATRTVVELLLKTGGKGLPKSIWEKAKFCGANHSKAYKLAIDSGVTIALGTDTPPGFNMAVELDYAVKAGMSNLEAIKAATANGPLTVKGQAPKSGQLKVGYVADIIGVTDNPARDVKILQIKENVKWVWKGGRLFKGPHIGPWGESL